ncbi:MAG: transglutaminase family protein [Rhizobiaceae bacterium]|nr:transglutaminase family protein [Rhizobiaceae bacterium]
MQLEVARTSHQTVENHDLLLRGNPQLTRRTAGGGIGERVWLKAEDHLDCTYSAQVSVARPQVELGAMTATPLQDLPADVIKYLLPSHYCAINDFDFLAGQQFGRHEGGELVTLMANWICETFTYDIGASNPTTSAQQSFEQRRGVCRDYAHVLISMARSSGIPARYASVYSPDVNPMDFHAVAEVYMQGAWQMIDPTGMSLPQRTAIIGVGRDATDVAFLTSFGDLNFVSQSVDVETNDSDC